MSCSICCILEMFDCIIDMTTPILHRKDKKGHPYWSIIHCNSFACLKKNAFIGTPFERCNNHLLKPGNQYSAIKPRSRLLVWSVGERHNDTEIQWCWSRYAAEMGELLLSPDLTWPDTWHGQTLLSLSSLCSRHQPGYQRHPRSGSSHKYHHYQCSQ